MKNAEKWQLCPPSLCGTFCTLSVNAQSSLTPSCHSASPDMHFVHSVTKMYWVLLALILCGNNLKVYYSVFFMYLCYGAVTSDTCWKIFWIKMRTTTCMIARCHCFERRKKMSSFAVPADHKSKSNICPLKCYEKQNLSSYVLCLGSNHSQENICMFLS